MSEDNGGDGNDPNPAPEESEKVSRLEADLTAARAEAAKYRTARNEALRRAHAQAAVLEAHKIKHEPTTEALDALTIEDGKVKGTYDYSPPDPVRQDLPQSPANQGMNMSDIKNMTADQINENWDEVSKVLAANNGR